MYTSKWGKAHKWREFDEKCSYNPREVQLLFCNLIEIYMTLTNLRS